MLTLAAHFINQGERVSLFSLREVCERVSAKRAGLSGHRRPLPQTLAQTHQKLSRRARQLDAAIEKAEQQGRFDLVLSNLRKTDRIVSRSRLLNGRNVWFCLHGVMLHVLSRTPQRFNRWMKSRDRTLQGTVVLPSPMRSVKTWSSSSLFARPS